jgi:late competence protein required for DNA uptake (superfamily II DNA/RNA helicase)
MTTKTQNELQKRPYTKKYKCNNCKGFTDSPGYLGAKRYCQKCLVFRRTHLNTFPTKENIKYLKEKGRWKK